jgi:hypothetical protein
VRYVEPASVFIAFGGPQCHGDPLTAAGRFRTSG